MREVLMILVFIPLLMPAVGLVTPLYLLINNFKIVDCGKDVTAFLPLFACDQGIRGKLIFNLRDSLLGVGIATMFGALPLALEVTPEMLVRTQPNLLDLLVAGMMWSIAAGLLVRSLHL